MPIEPIFDQMQKARWKLQRLEVQLKQGHWTQDDFAYTGKYPFCPVCGLKSVVIPEAVESQCRCCGFFFYRNDIDWTYEELREEWLSHDGEWAISEFQPSVCWDANVQLLNIYAQDGLYEKYARTLNDGDRTDFEHAIEAKPIIDLGVINAAKKFIDFMKSYHEDPYD